MAPNVEYNLMRQQWCSYLRRSSDCEMLSDCEAFGSVLVGVGWCNKSKSDRLWRGGWIMQQKCSRNADHVGGKWVKWYIWLRDTLGVSILDILDLPKDNHTSLFFSPLPLVLHRLPDEAWYRIRGCLWREASSRERSSIRVGYCLLEDLAVPHYCLCLRHDAWTGKKGKKGARGRLFWFWGERAKAPSLSLTLSSSWSVPWCFSHFS